jgi:F420-non-reducing hydrogenase iron-sulfur subunit
VAGRQKPSSSIFYIKAIHSVTKVSCHKIEKNFKLTMSLSDQPRIVAFVCNWCAYAGADLAGVSRLQYPSNVRLIRLMCTGRINHGFLLKTFVAGADGVLVSG